MCQYTFHTYLSMGINRSINMGKLILVVMVVKFFYRCDITTVVITITRECIDKSIYLSYFWNILCFKISLRTRRSHKERSILKKEAKNATLTHGAISHIPVSNTHCILREYSVADTECNLLVPYHKPRMVPEIIYISRHEE